MVILDAKSQDKLAKAKCLENAKPFREELEGLIKCSKMNIEDMCITKIDDKKLAELNLKIGERLGLEKALGILQSYEDELNEGKPNLAAKSPNGR